MPWIRKARSRANFGALAFVLFLIAFAGIFFVAVQTAVEDDLGRRERRVELEIRERTIRKVRQRELMDRIEDEMWRDESEEPFTLPPDGRSL